VVDGLREDVRVAIAGSHWYNIDLSSLPNSVGMSIRDRRVARDWTGSD
jgi:hypothetical protein